MARRYFGFAERIVEKEEGLFFKKVKEEKIFSPITVGGVDDFADAQETLCAKMNQHKITVAILLPYYKTEEGNWVIG
jgi:hypothetical protein